MSGALIDDNFRLVRPIAKGGMGSVWLARHTGLDLPVAMKFMSESLFRKEPNAVERFTREARAAAQLRHPNVVRIFDFRFQTPSDEPPYMVMELLEGEDLERCIRRCGPLEVREVVSIVRAVASVLDKAHAHGIVHRDIKPENIFLEGPERTVKVLDFGVAKVQQEHDQQIAEDEGTMCGTPCFMSPEQFTDAHQVDHRCDLWALAVVAYEALTGRMPFAGATVSAIFLAAARGKYTLPSRVRPELGPAIDAWFCKAFSAKVEGRFGSARELADAFAQAAAEQPPPGKRPGAMMQLVKQASSPGVGWSRWAAVSAGLLGGVLATLVFTGQLHFAPESAAATTPPPAPLPVQPVAAEPPAPPAPSAPASCAAPSPPASVTPALHKVVAAPRATSIPARAAVPAQSRAAVSSEDDESAPADGDDTEESSPAL